MESNWAAEDSSSNDNTTTVGADGGAEGAKPFYEMTPKEQVNELDPQQWSAIQVDDKVKVDWHPHELIKRPYDENPSWACDGKNYF